MLLLANKVAKIAIGYMHVQRTKGKYDNDKSTEIIIKMKSIEKPSRNSEVEKYKNENENFTT